MGYNKENESPLPNLNKGYGHESVKTERHDLLNDNPVAKDASGGRDGSWMSKHATRSRMGSSSPLMDNGEEAAEAAAKAAAEAAAKAAAAGALEKAGSGAGKAMMTRHIKPIENKKA